jgi:hypothetical protein
MRSPENAKHRRDFLGRLAVVPVLAALAGGCFWSGRFAWADYLFRLDTPSAVSEAARLVPFNAEYHARLAQFRGGSTSELLQAMAANPRLPLGLIALGLGAETRDDLAEAETWLARAAQADRSYSTLCILANFFFRHHQAEKFWVAARSALRIGDVQVHDPDPLFRLCWKMAGNAATVLERGIPDVGPVQARYLEFLVHENLAQVAEPVTERVMALGRATDLGAVFQYCDRLIAEGEADRAIHCWNALCWRTLRGYCPLAPQSGISLTNGDFSFAPTQHGFDWRIPPVEGISVERGERPPRLWISFDGRQPTACNVLEQIIAVAHGRRYCLRMQYQTDGFSSSSGLEWRISDAATGNEIESSGAGFASEQTTSANIRFTVPPHVHLARLVFGYRRTAGAKRIEGRVTLAAVRLEFDP